MVKLVIVNGAVVVNLSQASMFPAPRFPVVASIVESPRFVEVDEPVVVIPKVAVTFVTFCDNTDEVLPP
jgi:hypothetical protein